MKKNWNDKLVAFKKKALDSLAEKWSLADTEKGIGIAFQIEDRRFTNLCYFAGEWRLIDSNGIFVSPYDDISAEKLVKIIDQIHTDYTVEKKVTTNN